MEQRSFEMLPLRKEQQIVMPQDLNIRSVDLRNSTPLLIVDKLFYDIDRLNIVGSFDLD
jgi:hypothetical protein